MEARARVHAAHAGRVRLECESPAQACGACTGSRGCALRWLAWPGNPDLEVAQSVADAMPLHPGDGVTIEVDDGELLRAAAIAYTPPLVGLLAGPVAAAALTPGGELAALAGAVLGLTAGWGASRAWLRRSPPRYRLRMTEAR
jgi:positive regulator of sigma E activity